MTRATLCQRRSIAPKRQPRYGWLKLAECRCVKDSSPETEQSAQLAKSARKSNTLTTGTFDCLSVLAYPSVSAQQMLEMKAQLVTEKLQQPSPQRQ